jgi:hypothetical protein
MDFSVPTGIQLKGNRLDIRWKHPNPLCWDSIEGRLQEDGWGIENAEKEKGSEKGSEEKRGKRGQFLRLIHKAAKALPLHGPQVESRVGWRDLARHESRLPARTDLHR